MKTRPLGRISKTHRCSTLCYKSIIKISMILSVGEIVWTHFLLFHGQSLNCFVVMAHKVRAVTKTWCALKLSMDQFNNHFNSKKAAMEDFEILERKIASDIYERIWSISSKTQFEVLFPYKHQQIRLKFWNSCSLMNCIKAVC